MATADRVGKGESGMEKAIKEAQGKPPEAGHRVSQEMLYAALGKIVDRIEACGASIELTHAVTLASDLRQAVGNRFNPANSYALDRVIDAVDPPPQGRPVCRCKLGESCPTCEKVA